MYLSDWKKNCHLIWYKCCLDALKDWKLGLTPNSSANCLDSLIWLKCIMVMYFCPLILMKLGNTYMFANSNIRFLSYTVTLCYICFKTALLNILFILCSISSHTKFRPHPMEHLYPWLTPPILGCPCSENPCISVPVINLLNLLAHICLYFLLFFSVMNVQ